MTRRGGGGGARQAKPLSVAQRKSRAAKQLLETLGGDNTEAAVAAALEAVNARLVGDAQLQEHVRRAYEELGALAKPKGRADLGPAPVPIAGPSPEHFNPYVDPDPYQLLDWYGRDQLRAVLMRGTLKMLKERVAAVQARNPGTKPRSMSAKADMADYIVEHVAGPGY